MWIEFVDPIAAVMFGTSPAIDDVSEVENQRFVAVALEEDKANRTAMATACLMNVPPIRCKESN
mgnify:CR=1 FL=1